MATNLALDDRLIVQAQELGKHSSKKEAVTAALDEYIRHRQQQEILKLFGKIEYRKRHSHKRERAKRK